jgi:hypothetical protein
MQHTLKDLLWFNDLSPELKSIARVQILFIEKSVNRTMIQKLKLIPLHKRINDNNHIKRIINNLRAQMLINTRGVEYLDKYITGNFCEFDHKGQYYTFKSGGYRPYHLSF